MELVYPYVRARQLCSRKEFAELHPTPVLVFKKLGVGGEGETQLVAREPESVTPEDAAVARVLRHEAHQYRLVRLKSGVYAVGRAPESAIVLADDSVSRRHAEIAAGERVSVRDLGSDNGTIVIGKSGAQRVSAERVLEDADRVRFGSVLTHFFLPHAFFDFLATLLDPRAAPGHS